jgi:hypothetical protein
MYVYVRLGLTQHHRFSGCLEALLAWTRITCPDLLHSRITIAESMDDQSCANRIPVPIYWRLIFPVYIDILFPVYYGSGIWKLTTIT